MRELMILANHARESAATETDAHVKALWLQIADEIDAFFADKMESAETESALF